MNRSFQNIIFVSHLLIKPQKKKKTISNKPTAALIALKISRLFGSFIQLPVTIQLLLKLLFPNLVCNFVPFYVFQ